MSKLYILLSLAGLFLSCKKNNSTDYLGVNFVGHWQYQYQIGGQTGSKVYNPGETTTVLILNGDKTYQRLTNNNIQQQGTYNISQVKSFFTGNNDNAIDFDSSGSWKVATIQKDTLSIADNFADGYAQVYVKIK